MCTASSPVMWTIGNNAKQQPVTLHLGGHNDPATIGILGLSHLTAPVVASLLQAIPTGGYGCLFSASRRHNRASISLGCTRTTPCAAFTTRSGCRL